MTTFGGHPVSCAAAHANLRTLLDGDFAKKAFHIAEMACHMLRGEGITEVRGLGAMLGLQVRDAELTQKVVEHCFKKGIILGWTLHSNSLIRIAPPLIIEEVLLEECFKTILDGVKNYC